uniref:hairy/enhancer-of-split related with YRPW motif-like protein isoform X2 n=1 Tax=Styela clava TaxID=7725 RepID=UPI001939FCD4|nr:hairy/enhancer-of-split related with YRPW motif-like protein isoform X2 [Styela clava]
MYEISEVRPTKATQVRSLSETDVVPKSEPRIIQIAENCLRNKNTEFHQNIYETKKYHRLIEKRRRDRINECIFQLKDLLPTDVINSTTRSMEKAVILELVLQYMKSLNRRKTQENKDLEILREQAFICGFRDCTEKMFKLIDDKFNDHQKQRIRKDLQEQISFNITESSLQIKSDSPPSVISLSSLSNSSTPDLLQCAENSDSSGSGSMPFIQNKTIHKGVKRKILPRRSTKVPIQPTSSISPQSSPPEKKAKDDLEVSQTNSSVSNQVPIYINMPVMMNPGMIQAPTVINKHQQTSEVENTSAKPTPVMIPSTSATMFSQINGSVKPMVQMAGCPLITHMGGNMASGVPMQFQNGTIVTQMGSLGAQSGMQLSNGSLVPQISGNGVQYPTFFMACGTQSQAIQQDQQQLRKQQTVPVNPMILQPTIMMPAGAQGNVICMPSFPVMQPFQTSTLVSVQSPADGKKS